LRTVRKPKQRKVAARLLPLFFILIVNSILTR
jgi:hypothetical protein